MNGIYFKNRVWWIEVKVIPILNGSFWGCSRMGGRRPYVLKICHIYPATMKLSTVIPYLKKIQKILESGDTFLESCWHHVFFFTGNQTILLYQKWRYKLHFDKQFLILLTFFENGYNFDEVKKIATLDLLKIKLIWNKDYDVIISSHDVTNKILQRDSNYTGHVVMWSNVIKTLSFIWRKAAEVAKQIRKGEHLNWKYWQSFD